MKNPTLLCLPVAALLSWPMPGAAQNLVGQIGQAGINLVVPQGYCVADRAQAGVRFFVDYMSKALENSGDKLLQVIANCAELRARGANANASISNYMSYYFVQSEENIALDGDRQARRQAACDDLRAQTDEAVKDTPEISERTAREMKAKGSVKSSQYLGVLDADAHGCYGALLSRIDNGKGTISLQYVMLVRTVIHGKDLWVALYSEYGGPAANAKALQLAKTTAAPLDQKNLE
jgi:hypothetical protein